MGEAIEAVVLVEVVLVGQVQEEQVEEISALLGSALSTLCIMRVPLQAPLPISRREAEYPSCQVDIAAVARAARSKDY